MKLSDDFKYWLIMTAIVLIASLGLNTGLLFFVIGWDFVESLSLLETIFWAVVMLPITKHRP